MFRERENISNAARNTTTVFLGLGSNTGDRPEMFRLALHKLDRIPAIQVIALSPLYYTDPVDVDGGEFLNGVARLQTTYPPIELLRTLEEVERSLGRTGKGEKRPRNIDLDILLYGNEIVNTPSLSIPHAEMARRAFVLRPLKDLAPDTVVPTKNKTVTRLWEELADKGGLRPAEDLDLTTLMPVELIDKGKP